MSKNRPWPIEPCLKNFSNDVLTDEETGMNSFLKSPIIMKDVLLPPGGEYVFECELTVPDHLAYRTEKRFCTLNLFLTNP